MPENEKSQEPAPMIGPKLPEENFPRPKLDALSFEDLQQMSESQRDALKFSPEQVAKLRADREKITKRSYDLMGRKIPVEESQYACSDLRHQLKTCVMESDCVLNGGVPTQCMKDRKVDAYCYDIYFSMTQCHRRKMDPRYRLTGPNPGSSGKKAGIYTV